MSKKEIFYNERVSSWKKLLELKNVSRYYKNDFLECIRIKKVHQKLVPIKKGFQLFWKKKSKILIFKNPRISYIKFDFITIHPLIG